MGWFTKKTPEGQPSENAPTPRPHRSPTVRLHELLNASTIIVVPAGWDKAQVLQALVEAACASHGLGDPAPYLTRVREREEGISTTLDTGLSLPHARMEGLDGIVAALAVAPHGVPDPKQPGLSIRAMFLFFSPNRQEAFTLHLQLLRGVSTLFRPEFIDELVKAPTPPAALDLLRARS